jgi:putative SOS response-associated peptidase YedK
MCGGITSSVSPRDLKELFDVIRGLDPIPDWSPRYNIPQTAAELCVRETDEGREVFQAKWGLIPSWSKDGKPFGATFKSRRCLVITSGFYEWRKISAKEKQPYYMTLTSGEPVPMAGLWEEWHGPDGSTVESCIICTHTANDMMAPLHDRMPVILSDALVDDWLDRSLITADALQPMLGHYHASEMQSWPVSRDVGNVRNHGAYLVKPLNKGTGTYSSVYVPVPFFNGPYSLRRQPGRDI